MASHFESLAIQDIRRETPDTVSISFAIPPHLKEQFRFVQGQNIAIRTNLNGQEIRRSYSICSSPFEDELRIAVKKVPGGLFSSHANETLRPGDTLEVLPPVGKFHTPLDPSHQKQYLAFAAGSGITPVLSLIKTTLATEPNSHFTLVYGNRSRSSIIFREELEALKNRFIQRLALHHVLSREITDSPLYQGRITPEKCGQLCDKLIRLRSMDEIFLCGPADMIFSVKEWLTQQNIEKKKIHFELFTTQTPSTTNSTGTAVPASAATDPMAKTARVRIRLDGHTHHFDLSYDGEPILQAALAQGIDLPYACKGGVCCTCRAKLLEGQVSMDLNYALEDDELQQGFILTCQAHPKTAELLVDFDTK